MRIISLAALLLGLSAPLAAEVIPRAGAGDPHIQTVAYNPDEVVSLFVATGFALTLQFSPEEQIETVIIGDSGSWVTQTSRRADHLVLQPKGQPAPTNMTVFTDQRTYNFMLFSSPTGQSVQPFLVSFTYPSAVVPVAATAPVAGSYRLVGVKSLWPLEIADDGSATTIRWAPDMTMPAVYREGERGSLALVNGVMRDGAYVLDAVYPRLVFVLGKARARAVRQAGKP